MSREPSFGYWLPPGVTERDIARRYGSGEVEPDDDEGGEWEEPDMDEFYLRQKQEENDGE